MESQESLQGLPNTFWWYFDLSSDTFVTSCLGLRAPLQPKEPLSSILSKSCDILRAANPLGYDTQMVFVLLCQRKGEEDFHEADTAGRKAFSHEGLSLRAMASRFWG